MEHNKKRCPYCNEIIDSNLTICPICCEKLPEGIKREEYHCPFCNEIIDKNVEVCPICDEDLTKSDNTIKEKFTDDIQVKPKLKLSLDFKLISKYKHKIIILLLLVGVIYFVGEVLYTNFMYKSLFGTTKFGVEYLDEYRNACTDGEQLKAINGAYAIASNGIKKNPDKDMPYAIKGYASWVESTIYSKNKVELIKNNPRYKESVELTNKALSINPNNYIALQTLSGYSRTLENNTDKALEYINRAIAANPKYANLYYLRAQINIGLNADRKIILEDLDKALKYAPKASEYYRIRAAIKLAEPTMYKSALSDANKSIKLCKNPPADRYIVKSMARYLTQDTKGALEDCNKAFEIGFDNENTIKVYEEYRKELESKL